MKALFLALLLVACVRADVTLRLTFPGQVYDVYRDGAKISFSGGGAGGPSVAFEPGEADPDAVHVVAQLTDTNWQQYYVTSSFAVPAEGFRHYQVLSIADAASGFPLAPAVTVLESRDRTDAGYFWWGLKIMFGFLMAGFTIRLVKGMGKPTFDPL